MKFQQWPKRDPNKNYFMVPNEVFHIDLSHPKISIYCNSYFGDSVVFVCVAKEV